MLTNQGEKVKGMATFGVEFSEFLQMTKAADAWGLTDPLGHS